jgi:hypothetical protein
MFLSSGMLLQWSKASRQIAAWFLLLQVAGCATTVNEEVKLSITQSSSGMGSSKASFGQASETQYMNSFEFEVFLYVV